MGRPVRNGNKLTAFRTNEAGMFMQPREHHHKGSLWHVGSCDEGTLLEQFVPYTLQQCMVLCGRLLQMNTHKLKFIHLLHKVGVGTTQNGMSISSNQ